MIFLKKKTAFKIINEKRIEEKKIINKKYDFYIFFNNFYI